MPLWKAILSYDGTHLHGWQIQPALPTVQAHLSDALARITGERVLPQGSGRTDAGVHALAQVASFSLASPIPAANIHRALNHVLPSSIRVLSVDIVAPPFHARHSALSKTYEYRIFPRHASRHTSQVPPAAGRICSPMLAPFVWDCPLPLDLPSLQQAANYILGTHDFTSFAAANCIARDPATPQRLPSDPLPHYPDTPPSPCRTIHTSTWTCMPSNQVENGLLIYRVTGTGFLHHMVRNLVGTFVLAGSGRISPHSIPSILAARDRSAAGPTAPARGLFLVEVHYP